MESILHPPRSNSLDMRDFRIVEHRVDRSTQAVSEHEHEIKGVLLCEPVRALKQRIAVHHEGDPQWFPEWQFIARPGRRGGAKAAKAATVEYTPLEFAWPFPLQDPLAKDVLGRPDPRLFEHGERTTVFAELYPERTLENALGSESEVHVWTLGGIAMAAGTKPSTELRNELYEGFYKLYVPTLTEATQVRAALQTEMTKGHREHLDAMKEYLAFVDAQYAKLNAELGTLGALASPVLRTLRYVRFELPEHAPFTKGLLELKFYELKPSEALPFLRYFPAKERGAPIVQTGKRGTKAFLDRPLLELFMKEEPEERGTASMLLKSPVFHKDAPPGTTWTLTIYEGGRATVSIGAPRVNQPLPRTVVEAAFHQLPFVLEMTPWKGAAPRLHFSELTAEYECSTTIPGGKPDPKELRLRAKAMAPFLMVEPSLVKSTDVVVRYTPVSDHRFKKEDPMDVLITRLVLNEGAQVLEGAKKSGCEEALMHQFGVTRAVADEAIRAWVREGGSNDEEENRERIGVHEERMLAAAALGIVVTIENHHPTYFFSTASTKSSVDLNRILALMSLLVSKSSKELQGAAPGKAEAKGEAAAAAAVPEEEEEEEAPFNPFADAFQNADEEEEEEAPFNPFADALQGEGKEEDAEGNAAVEEAGAGAAGNTTGEEFTSEDIGKEWHQKLLNKADSELFKSDPGQPKYSTTCQSYDRKQLNVMNVAQYREAREKYGDTVHWVEAPFSAYDNEVLKIANQTPDSRKGKTSEIVKQELRALELGIALKANKVGKQSVTEIKSDATPKEKADIQAALKAQGIKTLMVVVRAGTNLDKPNYYICGEMWCVRDGLPVDPRAFEATSFRGRPKIKDRCPFCAGKGFSDERKPKKGETVWKRTIPGKPDQIYAGYQGILKRDPADGNKGFVVPCCFTTLAHLAPPADAKPIPKVVVPLPETQQGEAPVVAPVPVAPLVADENRARPFSEKARNGTTINHWFIPNQNIKGRRSEDWAKADLGDAVVPPPSVNTMLGQNPETFLTAPPSRGGVVNTYLAVPGTAFIRYSLGATLAEPGHNLLSLIAFAIYATEHYTTRNETLSIQSVRSIKELLCESDPSKPIKSPSKGDTGHMIHAFEQANYGTLLHEFSMPGIALPPAEQAKFNPGWVSKVGFPKTDRTQRAHLDALHKAWRNFENYIRDAKEPKALSTWEGLFAVPGLLTRTGVLLVRIRFPKSKDEPATIQCPRMGVAPIHQLSPPPFLLLVEQEETGLYDPLVLYTSTKKEDRHVYGIVHPDTDEFRSLPKEIQTPLRGFLEEYISPSRGCGRREPPIHPWMPVASSSTIPSVGDLLAFAEDKEHGVEVKALLRDVTNRLVGVLLKEKVEKADTLFYIPALDDGTVAYSLPSLRGDDAMPTPSFDKCIELLKGKQVEKVSVKKLAGKFPGLMPVGRVKTGAHYVGITLACGAELKIDPVSSMEPSKKSKASTLFEKLKVVDELRDNHPWTADARMLVKESDAEHAEDKSESIRFTEEEQLDEAYQHLRISFSNWLFTHEQGAGVLRQIELLRQARKRLPLFELQKRLEILLAPIIANSTTPWMTTEGTATPSILRRDCLQIKTKDTCVAGCVWSEERETCMIHTSKTPRYLHPIRVMTARLADELIRTFGKAREILEQKSLPFLKPVGNEIIYSDTSALFSTQGRGDSELYRQLGYTGQYASEFARGLTYPEETSVEREVRLRGAPAAEARGAAVAAELPADWAEKLEVREAAGIDARSQLVQAIVDITGKPKEELDKERGKPFTGSLDDWAWFATTHRIHVITTREGKGRVMIANLLPAPSSAAAPRFVILSPDGLPYVSKTSGRAKLTDGELPVQMLTFAKGKGIA